MKIDSAAARVGPIRTCVGCRTRSAQERLLRLHLDDRDRLRIDRSGHGRGAWLCLASSAACLRTAVERQQLDRAFRRRVDRSSIEALLVELDGRIGPDAVS